MGPNYISEIGKLTLLNIDGEIITQMFPEKRLFPIEVIDGKLNENDAIFANDTEIGKVLINDDYPFALIKFLDKNFDKDKIFRCKNGSIKVLIPDWLEIPS